MNWNTVIEARNIAAEVYGEPLTDTEAAALRWALVLAETEDEREAQNREAAGVVEWLHENNAAALYMEGTEPSPFISGGEVCYPSDMTYKPATEPDDDMPF